VSSLTRSEIDPADLAATSRRLAAEIGADHPEGVVLVGMLKGSLYVLADLARDLEVDCTVDFLALSAYRPGASRIKIMKDLDVPVAGKDVVLVKDVVDSGLSTHYALGLVHDRGARSVRVCSLIDRPQRRIIPIDVDYVGYEAGEEFLVGYGLDIGGHYRNLRGVHVVDPAALAEDPHPFEASVYPGRMSGSG